MATLFGRRYARRIESVRTTEKIAGTAILLLTTGIVTAFVMHAIAGRGHRVDADAAGNGLGNGYGDGAPPAAATTTTVSTAAAGKVGMPFPEPDLDGWLAPARVFHYSPATLHEKINGRAETYLGFGVVGLTFGSYRHESDATRVIDVYWYDMGEPANAAGIYHTEAPPDAPVAAVGDRAYQVGGAVFFQKGPYYVQVLPGRLDEADAVAAEQIARQLDARIAAADTGVGR